MGSELLDESSDILFADLCRQMAIVDGGNEYLKPRNVGLLFFHDKPEKFFPYIQIDVVYFPEDEGGDVIQEAIFKGPLDQQLRDALRHIKNNFIIERVLKIPGEAKAKRYFNYPYVAIEEALVNAVYHRSYDIREPIEVRINRTSISVVSHPGPDPSITLEDMQAGRMVSRRYRNRRIGEFLKELEFTEGRGTGVPKMRSALKRNGSPEPVFFTDGARQSFWTEIRIHPEFLRDLSFSEGMQAQEEAYVEAHVEAHVDFTETELKILKMCLKNPIGNKEIIKNLGYKSLSGNVKKALQKLKSAAVIAYTIPDRPKSRFQKYAITKKGRKYLEENYNRNSKNNIFNGGIY